MIFLIRFVDARAPSLGRVKRARERAGGVGD